MGIDCVFTWYQQKIGTYDKQRWETRIEQREHFIHGLQHIKTRSAKPNPDLIDLDLVRGSSFTKAKPRFGFIKVAQLATLRCILYPFFGYWWIEQTSKYVFIISLFIYILQLLNIGIYCIHLSTTIHSETLSCLEIVIPGIMLWILCLIQSQIVATSPTSGMEKSRFKHRIIRKNNLKKKLKSDSSEQSRIKKRIIRDRIERDFFHPKELVEYVMTSKKQDIVTVGESAEILTTESRIETSNGYCSTDSESETKTVFTPRRKTSLASKIKIHIPEVKITSQFSNCETDEEIVSTPTEVKQNERSPGDLTSSATEWMGATTNSDCSYSSDMENISDSQIDSDKKDCYNYDNEIEPQAIINAPTNQVSCIIWHKNEVKKADLTMVEISSAIIGKVDSMPERNDYFYIGLVISTLLAYLPILCKILNASTDNIASIGNFIENLYINVTNGVQKNQYYFHFVYNEIFVYLETWLLNIFEGSYWENVILIIALIQRWILASMIFFLLAVAEKTFTQRLLYAKLFSHLTSSRRARKSEIPHFRLNKVINIKTWLSVRSYLKKRGPQRSVDIIVSTAFVANLLLITFLCVEVLKDTVLISQYYLEALLWCIGLGILLLRFMTLGTKINKKYRNLSVLITEQINLHLQIEQKPNKKDELTVANNVLKLAIDLLKELENPFKISGISANPILYNCTKLVILSALSGVFSEMLGFKLKLHKLKLK